MVREEKAIALGRSPTFSKEYFLFISVWLEFGFVIIANLHFVYMASCQIISLNFRNSTIRR